MKKWLKIPLLIVVILIAALYIINEYQYIMFSKKGTKENDNINLNFIDKLGYHYEFQTAYQNPDGSIYAVSGMSDRSWYKDYISIIKLSPEGNVLRETKTMMNPFNWKDLLPGNIRNSIQQENNAFSYGITLAVVRDKSLYLLYHKGIGDFNVFSIWQFDLNGKLLQIIPVDLKLDKYTSYATTENNGIIYLTYVDGNNNTLNLERISVTSGSFQKSIIYKPEQTPYKVEGIWSDEFQVLISALDSGTEICRIYSYDEQNGISEYYTTKPNCRIRSMCFYYTDIIVAVQSDSLLEIVDITKSPDSAEILETIDNMDSPAKTEISDNLGSNTWVTTDMVINYSGLYVSVDYGKMLSNKKPMIDCMVRKYNLLTKSLVGTYYVQGPSTEMSRHLYFTKDKQQILLGTSFSTNQLKLMRVFATKFKL